MSTNDSTQRIIAERSTSLLNAVRPHMPSMTSMQRTVQRIRKGTIALPRSLTELTILDKYKFTKHGEPFLLFDSGASENRVLLFSTKKNLDFLSESND